MIIWRETKATTKKASEIAKKISTLSFAKK